MKKLNLILCAVFLLGFLNSAALAKNEQDYKLNEAECQKYIELSRGELDKGNLGLARAYAKKAVQANAWSKFAWANYDDIIQHLADEGDIEEFGTVVEESQASENAPSAGSGEAQFEGC